VLKKNYNNNNNKFQHFKDLKVKVITMKIIFNYKMNKMKSIKSKKINKKHFIFKILKIKDSFNS